jgi:hypothetical protein
MIELLRLAKIEQSLLRGFLTEQRACQNGRDQTARAPMLVRIFLMLGSPERSARGLRVSIHDTEMGRPVPHTVSTKNVGAYGEACQVQRMRARNTLNALPVRLHAYVDTRIHVMLCCALPMLPWWAIVDQGLLKHDNHSASCYRVERVVWVPVGTR